MKSYFLLFLGLSSNAFAEEVLQNCYAARGTWYHVIQLENIAAEGQTAITLLNSNHEVVGYIAVELQRNKEYPYNSMGEVTVRSLGLCSNLQVDNFSYTSDEAENILNWEKAKPGELRISQDEGLIVLNLTKVERTKDLTKVHVDFHAYDVFVEDVPETSTEANFEEDWGLPRGSGSFYFYLPRNWK